MVWYTRWKDQPVFKRGWMLRNVNLNPNYPPHQSVRWYGNVGRIAVCTVFSPGTNFSVRASFTRPAPFTDTIWLDGGLFLKFERVLGRHNQGRVSCAINPVPNREENPPIFCTQNLRWKEQGWVFIKRPHIVSSKKRSVLPGQVGKEHTIWLAQWPWTFRDRYHLRRKEGMWGEQEEKEFQSLIMNEVKGRSCYPLCASGSNFGNGGEGRLLRRDADLIIWSARRNLGTKLGVTYFEFRNPECFKTWRKNSFQKRPSRVIKLCRIFNRCWPEGNNPRACSINTP